MGLIVIDYLQLMTTGQRSENRVQEISSITRNLKIMAKELDVYKRQPCRGSGCWRASIMRWTGRPFPT